ncbi:MAG: polysaccharide deacetylase family protein [Magnetospirillum sp.]|nr:polysaccharide deacetylase family protein [Magnetospirillum sp.]
MSLRHHLATPLLLAHRLVRAVRSSPPGVRLLLLHDVPTEAMPAFERLVAWLAASGRLASPAVAEAVLDGGAVPPGPERCVLTFDDGFVSNVAAARVLERHGARGLFFLCPGLMDLSGANQRAAVAANVFDGRIKPGALPEALRPMTWDEAAALSAAGHAIGSHSLLHRRLTRLGGGELERDLATAAQMLGERLGRAIPWFAFTFGDIGSVSADVLAAVGRHHRYCRSGIRGANRAGTPPLALLADQIDPETPWAWQRLAVEGGLDRRYAAARARLAAMASQQG